MTYIEFFSQTVSENICACLANPPERVVLLGDNLDLMERHAARYAKFFRDRGHTVEFLCRTVERNNLQKIVQALLDLLDTYGDCAFDLTGGYELFLVAVGILSERYKDRNIQMHRFNIQYGTILDCDQDGKTILEDDSLQMTVEENVRLFGGAVVYDDVKSTGTHRWDMNWNFRQDIWDMWEICREEVRQWNRQLRVLENMYMLGDKTLDGLTVTAPVEQIERSGVNFEFNKAILDALYECGVLTYYIYDGWDLTVGFKNDQVRRVLTKAGQLLELVTYLAVLEATDKKDRQIYNDAQCGVCMDWDGHIQTPEEGTDTENEIDVLMMHGIQPVFVSCKNGSFKVEELYKLHAVAQRFGGRHAKKVLVATAMHPETVARDAYLCRRAKAMGIRVVTNLQKLDREQLNQVVCDFWNS